MRLFTSHWRSLELRALDAVPVSISRGRPRWSLPYRYRRYDELAPDDRTWAHEDLNEFERSYISQLEALGADTIMAGLRRISEQHGGKALCLLCWEKPGEFCHRRVLAAFIARETGIMVPELEPGDVPQRLDALQPSLFAEEQLPREERT